MRESKVIVTSGEYKGTVGVLTGVFWASNTATIKADDGREIVVEVTEYEPFRSNFSM